MRFKTAGLGIRKCFLLVCATALFFAARLQATSIAFSITSLGTDVSGNAVDQLTYTVSGLTLQSSQELDLMYDPTVYRMLSNPVIGPAFTALLFQPDNPTGTSGDFGIVANADNTPLTGPFSVDVTLVGSAVLGPQPFTISQFDLSGNFIGIISAGSALPVSAPTNMPEPAAGASTALALLLGVLGRNALRRRAVPAA